MRDITSIQNTTPDQPLARPVPLSLVFWGALGFGLLAHFLFFAHVAGVSFFIFVDTYLLFLLIGCRRSAVRYSRPMMLFFPFILFFSAMVAVRSSAPLTFLNILATLGLCLLQAQYLTGKNVFRYTLAQYIGSGISTAVAIVRQSFAAAADVARLRSRARPQAATQVARGVLVTVPILIVFVVLFSSADLVFGTVVSRLITFHLSPELVPRILFTGFVTFVFLGIFSHVFKNFAEPAAAGEGDSVPVSGFGAIEVSILIGSLCALFLLFIAVQVKYLFAGSTALSAYGLTYAQYAHKGFVELNAAAVLTFGIVWAVQKYAGAQHGDRLWYKLLVGAVILETYVILLSGFKRLSLYESAYGFTSLRLYGHIFVVWLACVLGLLLYKIAANARNSVLAFEGLALVVFCLVFLNLLNPDAFIARQNIRRYTDSGKLDDAYMQTLSADASAVTAPLAGGADPVLRRAALQHLWALEQRNYESRYTGDWRSFNLAWYKTSVFMRRYASDLRNYEAQTQQSVILQSVPVNSPAP